MLGRREANAGTAPGPRQRRNPHLSCLYAHTPEVRVPGVVGRAQLPVDQAELDPVTCASGRARVASTCVSSERNVVSRGSWVVSRGWTQVASRKDSLSGKGGAIRSNY